MSFWQNMSGQEFSVLVAGGFLPVGIVMGVCVYHIARQRPRAVLAISVSLPSSLLTLPLFTKPGRWLCAGSG